MEPESLAVGMREMTLTPEAAKEISELLDNPPDGPRIEPREMPSVLNDD